MVGSNGNSKIFLLGTLLAIAMCGCLQHPSEAEIEVSLLSGQLPIYTEIPPERNPCTPFASGQSPLSIAVQRKDNQSIKHFLEVGCNPDLENDAFDPLWQSAFYLDERTVRKLLEIGTWDKMEVQRLRKSMIGYRSWTSVENGMIEDKADIKKRNKIIAHLDEYL